MVGLSDVQVMKLRILAEMENENDGTVDKLAKENYGCSANLIYGASIATKSYTTAAAQRGVFLPVHRGARVFHVSGF